MSETLLRGTPPIAAHDQASGLRRIFDRAGARWTLVLQPPLRAAHAAEALAMRARLLAMNSGPTLLVDASRAQVASALGLRLRYDLEHVLAADCSVEEACVAVGDALAVLPAARALDVAAGDRAHGLRVAHALQGLAAGRREVVLVMSAGGIPWLRDCVVLEGMHEALIPVYGSADAGTAVLTTIRQAASELDIKTFRLLFLGMGEATAGRLLVAMAAIARRHFGATLLAEEPMPGEPGARLRARYGASRMVP